MKEVIIIYQIKQTYDRGFSRVTVNSYEYVKEKKKRRRKRIYPHDRCGLVLEGILGCTGPDHFQFWQALLDNTHLPLIYLRTSYNNIPQSEQKKRINAIDYDLLFTPSEFLYKKLGFFHEF